MKLNTMRLYPSLPLSSYTLCGKYGLRTYENGYQQDCFFTAPICRGNSLVERRFTKRDLGFVFYGSSSDITVTSKGVQLKNDTITVSFEWEKEQFFEMSPTRKQLISKDLILRPTFNGITVTQQYTRPIFFTFSACEEAVGHIRMNSKCFAYMEEKFKPYVTLNALYATSVANKATGVELAMQQTSATSFRFRMRALANEVKSLTWCINMYEPKLIQDTTVESQRPKENNVYGEVSFLGRSAEHGLQYLYSRFDFSKIAVDTTKKQKNPAAHSKRTGRRRGSPLGKRWM